MGFLTNRLMVLTQIFTMICGCTCTCKFFFPWYSKHIGSCSFSPTHWHEHIDRFSSSVAWFKFGQLMTKTLTDYQLIDTELIRTDERDWRYWDISWQFFTTMQYFLFWRAFLLDDDESHFYLPSVLTHDDDAIFFFFFAMTTNLLNRRWKICFADNFFLATMYWYFFTTMLRQFFDDGN